MNQLSGVLTPCGCLQVWPMRIKNLICWWVFVTFMASCLGTEATYLYYHLKIMLRQLRLCPAHPIHTDSSSVYEKFHNCISQLIKWLLQSHEHPTTGRHHLMLWRASTMDVSTRMDRTSHPTRLEWKLTAPTSASNASARYLFLDVMV